MTGDAKNKEDLSSIGSQKEQGAINKITSIFKAIDVNTSTEKTVKSGLTFTVVRNSKVGSLLIFPLKLMQFAHYFFV